MRRAALLCGGLLLALATAAFAVDKDLRKLAKDPDSRNRSEAARLLARDGSVEATKLLVGLMQDRDPYTRDAAVIAGGKLTEEASIALVAKQLKSPDEAVRANAAASLGRTKSPHALPHLAAAVEKDKSSLVRATALDSLWSFAKDAAAFAVARSAVKDADPVVRAAAIEAVGRIRGEGDLALTEAALADPDPGVRAVARMELRFVDRARAEERLAEVAKDPDWRVRAQGVDDARALRGVPSMTFLVAAVADPNARVAEAAHRALVALSGKGFGRDAALWTSWWDTAKESWTPPEGARDDGAPPKDEKATTARYHGVPVASQALVFVIDASGSMRDAAPGDSSSRWEKAEAELVKTVEALPDGTLVNVVLFQEEVTQAFDAPQPLDKKSRKAVATFLKRTSPGQSGDLLAGVLAALAQEGADTIYLLSDGAPSAGRMVDKVRVRRAIRSVNRRRKLAIHTIGFGATSKTQRAFLEGVAREAGSVCVLGDS